MCFGLLALAGALGLAAGCAHLASLGAEAAAFGLVGAATGALDAAVNVLPLWAWGAGVDVYVQATHVAFTAGAALAPLAVAASLASNGSAPAPALLGLALLAAAAAPAALCVASPANPASPPPARRPAIGGGSGGGGARWFSHAAGALARFARGGGAVRATAIAALLFVGIGLEAGFGGLVGTYVDARAQRLGCFYV